MEMFCTYARTINNLQGKRIIARNTSKGIVVRINVNAAWLIEAVISHKLPLFADASIVLRKIVEFQRIAKKAVLGDRKQRVDFDASFYLCAAMFDVFSCIALEADMSFLANIAIAHKVRALQAGKLVGSTMEDQPHQTRDAPGAGRIIALNGASVAVEDKIRAQQALINGCSTVRL